MPDNLNLIDAKIKFFEEQVDTRPWVIELLKRIKKQQIENPYIENIQLKTNQPIDEDYKKVYERCIDDFIDDTVHEEFLLEESSSRSNLLPIRYPAIWNCYKLQESNIWFVAEINWDEDQFDQMPVNIQIYVIYVLAFFAGIDGIIASNLSTRFTSDVKVIEALTTYAFQTTMEYIHNHTYNLNLEIYVKDEEIRSILFDSIKYIPSIQKKALWCYKWINSDKTFAHRIVAFIAVEGINFAGSFGSIFWLQSRGYILPGLFQSNDMIRRDETTHFEFGIELYNYLANKLKHEVIKEIFSEAVDNEIAFINEALSVQIIGLNSDSMVNYIKYVANSLLSDMNISKLYDIDDKLVELEFPFMLEGSVEDKNNFFEKRGSSYQNSHNDDKKKIFNKNADV